ncbi:PREDICTED: proline dehydrogenase 1, mitochondrial-like [Dinoponera quadriceps]|uniref:Proline dehydrogenase n=1 Tax=Dinoponera quadriceps TaxID=609295 RepID=A0A6P3YGA9_DINQU|nr:PREDICTED: proline dehydrogenase 1, mitochondrial-like [Dinoponera quadriceps]
MDIFIRCLETVAGASMGMGITAVKLTALGRPQLLLQLSEVIMRARQYMTEVVGGEGAVLAHHLKPDDFTKKFEEAHIKDAAPVQKFLQKIQSDKERSGILDENYKLSETFQVPDMKTGKMMRLISQLTSKEEEMFKNMIRRLNNIVTVADELDVRIMIDAEQTYFQPAISRLTLEMMRKYNVKKAVVFNTYQTYLQEAFNEVKTDLEQAERQNFYFAAKLVRGAYIEQRTRAAAMGYPDPTNPTYEATTESYHKTLMECLRRIKQYKDKGEDPKKIGIMVASHNEDTVCFAIEKSVWLFRVQVHPVRTLRRCCRTCRGARKGTGVF